MDHAAPLSLGATNFEEIDEIGGKANPYSDLRGLIAEIPDGHAFETLRIPEEARPANMDEVVLEPCLVGIVEEIRILVRSQVSVALSSRSVALSKIGRTPSMVR